MASAAPGGSRPAPPYGQLRVVDDVPAAFVGIVAEAAAAAERTLLALSGGATARACYERLASSDELAWERLECVLGDERCVSGTDPDSNAGMIREALGGRLAQLSAFYPMDCEAPGAYASLIERIGPIDLVHLGLGPDGHTASLFSGSEGLEAPPGALVVRNSDPNARNPHDRMTLTLEAINASRLAVFTVSGEQKREALRAVLRGEDLPATRVRAGSVVWLCDREALGPQDDTGDRAGSSRQDERTAARA